MRLLFDKIYGLTTLVLLSLSSASHACPGLGVGHMTLNNDSGEKLHYVVRRYGEATPQEGNIRTGKSVNFCWTKNIKMHGGHGIYGDNLKEISLSQKSDGKGEITDGLTCKIKVTNGGVHYGKVRGCTSVSRKGSTTKLYKVRGCNNSAGSETCKLHIGLQAK